MCKNGECLEGLPAHKVVHKADVIVHGEEKTVYVLKYENPEDADNVGEGKAFGCPQGCICNGPIVMC